MNKEPPIIRTVNFGEDHPVFRVVDGKEVQISKEELQRPHRTVCDITTGTTRLLELTDEEMAEQQTTKAAWDAEAPEREERQRKVEEEERKFVESLHYEERLVAFIDILGWSAAVRGFKHGEDKSVEKLGKALAPLKNFTNFTESLKALMLDTGWHGDPVASYFSDCFVFSVKDDLVGRQHLLSTLHSLSWNMAPHGFLLRGGIARGEIYHKNGLVFGSALIEAYELERDHARHPRIILSKEIAKDLGEWGSPFDTPWIKDKDGWYFFNFLPPFMGNAFFNEGHTL